MTFVIQRFRLGLIRADGQKDGYSGIIVGQKKADGYCTDGSDSAYRNNLLFPAEEGPQHIQ